ncbi:PREDICTED: uncharacterized protein LOC105559885 [Vollenhovia emeryi]|uniref:uncharacterized protein LOC105559885 n=1 Tax=Vollenhovia emeryi TaxID=411798 RepID=UPI0005F51706|nr:PREDICTED: uncharacterized protein LOC105559885 [Vollenhovia emeryi]
MLNNNSQHRLQVVAWNNEVERIQCFIQPNKIIHIDGAKAKKPKITDFNHGTLPYELIVCSNTIINILGTFDIKLNINAVQPQKVTLTKIPEYLNSYIGKYQ